LFEFRHRFIFKELQGKKEPYKSLKYGGGRSLPPYFKEQLFLLKIQKAIAYFFPPPILSNAAIIGLILLGSHDLQ
jgi:hypothetical protein